MFGPSRPLIRIERIMAWRRQESERLRNFNHKLLAQHLLHFSGYTCFFFSTGDNKLKFYFWLLLHTQRGNKSGCVLLKNLSSFLDAKDAKLNTSLAQIQNTTFESVVSLSQPSDTSPPPPPPNFLKMTLTLICQELSHFTSLKFLPKLLLVQKHTLRILTDPSSPVKFSSEDSILLSLGLGTFQPRVSPDITSYIVTVV